MRKKRKPNKMINAQLFSYPNIKLRFNKDLTIRNITPGTEVKRVIWTSLLGKDNKELTMISLLNSPKFITFIEKTRQDFVKNHSNLHKYPKLNESDWE